MGRGEEEDTRVRDHITSFPKSPYPEKQKRGRIQQPPAHRGVFLLLACESRTTYGSKEYVAIPNSKRPLPYGGDAKLRDPR